MKKYFLSVVALLLIATMTAQAAFADGISDYVDEVNRILAQPNPEPDTSYLSPSYYYHKHRSEIELRNLAPTPAPSPSPAMQRLDQWLWWRNRGYWQYRFQREWNQRQWD